MNLATLYWYFKIGLPKNVCDQIIKLAELRRKQNQHALRQAQVGGRGQDLSRFPLSKIENEKLLITNNLLDEEKSLKLSLGKKRHIKVRLV